MSDDTYLKSPEDPSRGIRARHEEIGSDWEWLGSLLPCELAQSGNELRGFSFRPTRNQWLLTVRVTLEGTLGVVFTSTGTPTGCVASFRERWTAGRCQVFPDRYA